MSHELRTSLNSILVRSNMLSQNSNNNLLEKQVEFSRTINRSCTDLLNLLNDLLDFSKVEAVMMELNLCSSTLKTLKNKYEQNYSIIAEKKEIAFEIIIGNLVPYSIYTDVQKVEQIIRNFLSNAFKFTEKGKVQLVFSRPDKKC